MSCATNAIDNRKCFKVSGKDEATVVSITGRQFDLLLATKEASQQQYNKNRFKHE